MTWKTCGMLALQKDVNQTYPANQTLNFDREPKWTWTWWFSIPNLLSRGSIVSGLAGKKVSNWRVSEKAASWQLVITCLLQPTHVVNITLGKLLKESNLWCIDTVHSPSLCQHWDSSCKPVELLHLSSERCHHPRRDGAPLLEAPNPTDNEISESQQKPALRQRTDTSPWARTMQMTSWMWSTWILFTATGWVSQSLLTRKFSACACKVSNLSVGMLCLAFWSQKQPWMKRNTWKKNFLVWSS